MRFQLHHQSGKKEGRKHSSCSFWQRTPVNKASLWPTCGISGKPMAWPLGNWEVRAQQGCNGHFPLKGVCPESVSSAPGLLTVTSQNIHLVRVTFTRIRHTFFRGWWKVPFRYNTIYSTTLSFSLMQSSMKFKKKKKKKINTITTYLLHAWSYSLIAYCYWTSHSSNRSMLSVISMKKNYLDAKQFYQRKKMHRACVGLLLHGCNSPF